MSKKSLRTPSKGMPWLVIIATIVILIVITLTSTVVIQGEDDRVAEETFDEARVAAPDVLKWVGQS